MTPPAAPAAEPQFEMQHSVPITIARSSSGNELSLVLKTGAPKYKDNPYSEPTAITTGEQQSGISYLKVCLSPGKIRIDSREVPFSEANLRALTGSSSTSEGIPGVGSAAWRS
jgi:hypothetical protein